MTVKDATAKRIEQLCKERGIAYNELANICGITPSTIYSIMDSKRRDISLSTVKKICDGLELTLSDFFSSPLFDSLEQEIR
ncbi:helix-turn-helix domain-containing protein [Lachnoclostridium edouardi]|uniref:helix-turn-helix domain-containing protein n=1 Tax=Lachnoclostridium edouardi TaxID=1926283 RepID=UPI000C7E1636|nr:helix-turn-helix transcriptional regulator [Lachnoclostridium edouardi]